MYKETKNNHLGVIKKFCIFHSFITQKFFFQIQMVRDDDYDDDEVYRYYVLYSEF